MKFEADAVTVLTGDRHGLTLGGPIAVEIGNTEWPKWETVMASDPVAAVAQPTAGQLVGDVRRRHLHTGDHALDHSHQGAAMGFTSSGPTQHVSHPPTLDSPTVNRQMRLT